MWKDSLWFSELTPVIHIFRLRSSQWHPYEIKFLCCSELTQIMHSFCLKRIKLSPYGRISFLLFRVDSCDAQILSQEHQMAPRYDKVASIVQSSLVCCTAFAQDYRMGLLYGIKCLKMFRVDAYNTHRLLQEYQIVPLWDKMFSVVQSWSIWCTPFVSGISNGDPLN